MTPSIQIILQPDKHERSFNRRLTPRQVDVIVAIRNFTALHGYSPTLREIGENLGIHKVTVLEHVGHLKANGYLCNDPDDKNRARQLRLAPDVRLPDEHRKTLLPMLGHIRDGCPIGPADQESLDLEQFCSRTSGVYVLRVRGSGLTGEHLRNGDFLIVERRAKARNGEVIIAVLSSGEAVIARYYFDGTKIRLQPLDHSRPPKPVDPRHMTVQGVVIGMLRGKSRAESLLPAIEAEAGAA